ncbi:hypothetical protein WJX72_007038 [[Myrmecia] bisecta]|uniref:Auxin efflux carrier n=1 Tax=[Myrmecia] bisecta TaxID=41462 RepID=A0AAW1PDA4_9CHLO
MLSPELAPQAKAGVGAVLQRAWSLLPSLPSWQSVGAKVQAWLQSDVLGASVSATCKLIMICAFVGWLLHTDRLAPNTAPVLSKVAFALLIPCMLFSKVAATLSAQPDPTLFAIPLAASLQVLVGVLLGTLAAKVVEGSYSRKRTIFGWHPLNPAKSAAVIAATTAAATGAPAAAEALLQRPKSAPTGTRQLVLAACSFGNSLTLPLVFLTSLLPAAAADRAAGYTALFLMGWSPLLWSLGYQLLGGAGTPRVKRVGLGTADDVGAAKRSVASNVGTRRGVSFAMVAVTVSEAIRRAASALHKVAKQVINPPLIGVICGVLVGVTPLGSVLFQPKSAAALAVTAQLPMELHVAIGLLRSVADVLSLLGSATLAVQTVVLGASMFPKPVKKLAGGSELERYKAEEEAEEAHDHPASVRPPSLPTSLFRFFVPSDAINRRVLAAVALVRCVCMPMATLGIVAGLNRLGMLPADPVCQLAIMVQGAMPSAQNLVLLMQLREETQPLAPKFAQLLLRLYSIAILPLTLWMAVFAARMPVPLSTMV